MPNSVSPCPLLLESFEIIGDWNLLPEMAMQLIYVLASRKLAGDSNMEPGLTAANPRA